MYLMACCLIMTGPDPGTLLFWLVLRLALIEERVLQSHKVHGLTFPGGETLCLIALQSHADIRIWLKSRIRAEAANSTAQVGAAAVRARQRCDADVLLPSPVKLGVALSIGLSGGHMDCGCR